MEKLIFNKDINVFYITAKSFPDGILEAHQKLHALIPFSRERKYFGLSRPEKGGTIVYKAAAEEMYPGEGENLQCESLILKKGAYVCLTVTDYVKYIEGIRITFEKLISTPDIDPEGYCVEWYINDTDVKCMVRLKD